MLSACRGSRRRSTVLLGLLCSTLATTFGCTTTSRHYVRDARIASSSQGDGNWIEPGSSTVLLLREYDPGCFFAVDDELFQKLTIELPHAKAGDRFWLGDDGVSVLLTKGASAWAHQGGYCTAATGGGEIAIVAHGENGSVTARLSLVLNCESRRATPRNREPRRVRIDGEYDFAEIAYDDLTPWLGREAPAGYLGFAVSPNAGR